MGFEVEVFQNCVLTLSSCAGNILSKVQRKAATLDDSAASVMFKFDRSGSSFVDISPETRLDDLGNFFDKHSSGLVTEKTADGDKVLHVLTKIDLLRYYAAST